MVSDTLIHEMLHAFLMLRGENPAHNAAPWCRMITELTPGLAAREIKAEPVGTMRVPNPDRDTDPKAPKTKVVRRPKPGCLTQDQLARWPHSIRPAGLLRRSEADPGRHVLKRSAVSYSPWSLRPMPVTGPPLPCPRLRGGGPGRRPRRRSTRSYADMSQ